MAPVYKFSNAGFLGRTYKSVLAENSVFVPVPFFLPAMDLIQTYDVTSNQATISFTNISQYSGDFRHLQLRLSASTNRTGFNNDPLRFRFNGDATNGNYYNHRVLNDQDYGLSSSGGSYSAIDSSNVPINSTSVHAAIIDIVDAFNIAKYKSTREFGGGIAYGNIRIQSGLWLSTQQIDQIDVTSLTGKDMVSGSRVSLYGVR